MKTKPLLPLLALVASLVCHAPVAAASHDHAQTAAPTATAAGSLVEPTDHDSAWLALARKDYALKTCLISKEVLGTMGEPIDLIYRADGKPDRLVRFCCKSCIKKFSKDPEKYLVQLVPEAKPSSPRCP